jgi:competence protein ComEA
VPPPLDPAEYVDAGLDLLRPAEPVTHELDPEVPMPGPSVTQSSSARPELDSEVPMPRPPATQSWTARPEPDGGDPPPGWLSGFVPAGLRGGRWDPGRRGVAALAGVAVAAAVVTGVFLLRSRPQEVAPPPVAASAAPAASGAVVVVDVAGRVRHPGLVRLPWGARVDDAVRAAGGPLPGATFDGLNLARKLADGEQVLVGVQAPAGSPGQGSTAGGDARVDLNTADVAALDALPGIGPVLAQKIVDWRTEHGRFASVDQLREVSGIGESKFAALKSKVRT